MLRNNIIILNKNTLLCMNKIKLILVKLSMNKTYK